MQLCLRLLNDQLGIPAAESQVVMKGVLRGPQGFLPEVQSPAGQIQAAVLPLVGGREVVDQRH